MNTDKRTSIALLLILVVTMVFMQYQKKQMTERKAREAQEQAREADRLAQEAEKTPKAADEDEAEPTEPADIAKAPEEPAPTPKPEPEPRPETAPKTATAEKTLAPAEEPVGTERQYSFRPTEAAIELTFTTLGGAISRAALPQYPTSADDESPLELIRSTEAAPPTLALVPAGKGLALPLDSVNYDRVETDDEEEMIFRRDFEAGMRVTKRYESPAGAQHVTLTVTFTNTGSAVRELQYEVFGGSRVMPEFFDRGNYVEGAVAIAKNNNGVDVERKKPGKLIDGDTGEPGKPSDVPTQAGAPVLWTGSSNKYFAALLRPLPENENGAGEPWIYSAQLRGLWHVDREVLPDGDLGEAQNNVVASFVTQPFEIAPGDTVTHRYLLYIGPKDRKLMGKVPAYEDFSGIVDYGWFEIFSSFLLMLLDFFYKIIPNYGVGIILLTLVVRGALHPLQRKAQISMRRMQKLQPEIKKLQEKHKGDKQKLSQEQMALFREAGVNPMGGCLPLFFQLPIIIGLFRAIQLSVDLRCAPFILWIDDLSRPDNVVVGDFSIHVLPILMIVSFIVQQMTMPKPPDPQQAKQQKTMMVMMTVMFGWLFYSMASGVVLYWLTSTFVGILEQKQIKASLARMEEEDALKTAGKSGKARPKS